MPEDHDLLARIDERLRSAQAELTLLRSEFEDYVTRTEFAPVKMIAYGLAGLILSAVVAALVASVLRGQP